MIETDYGMEINAVRHCTFACSNCNHASTRYTEKYFMDPAVLKRDLDVMKKHIRTKLLFVQGGEPLLHPKVVELLRLCLESGIAKQCGVLSNGTLLKKMGDDFWKLLHAGHCELRLSCYPDLNPDIVPWIEAKAREWNFFVRPQQIDGFKPVFRSVPDGSTYYGCPWRRCLTIHEGFFYLCPLSTFWPQQFMSRVERWKDISPTVDGLAIEGMTDEKLQAFLNRQHPLESCKICSGATGPSIPWHQNASQEEWEKEAGIAEALV
jgi:cyclic pyranopterin phosphate synthase